MAALFCALLLAYFLIVFRGKMAGGPELAKLLWALYFALGLSAMVVAATDVLESVYPPNYPSALYLFVCVVMGISGFLSFRARDISHVLVAIRGQRFIENFLIVTQLYSMIFFLPFAIMSLSGDANTNRWEIADKMDLLGSYGLLNTVAGAASHLFTASLVLACIRMAQPVGGGRSVSRASMLTLASLSYVVYILAYVGRDGVVFWLMSALAVFILFRPYVPHRQRQQIVITMLGLAAFMLLPFVIITVARFTDWDHGTAWSVLEYFGRQISTFSDYSSIERPVTLGLMNFSMFIVAGCSVVGLPCESWVDLKGIVFDLYLAQGKEPWLFGTYISDFVGDFGFLGAFVLLSLFALLCHYVCRRGGGHKPLTLSRLLLILFLYLVPYWGVFYFRFSIANGFIIVNLALVFLVWLLQRVGSTPPRNRRRALLFAVNDGGESRAARPHTQNPRMNAFRSRPMSPAA